MAHVLVVDDEPEIVKLVMRILSVRGHSVSSARDGQEALDAIAADRPDVLVIDLALPKLDGLEVTRRLRATCSCATSSGSSPTKRCNYERRRTSQRIASERPSRARSVARMPSR